MQIQTRNKGSMADVQRKAQALAALAENFGKPLSPALAGMWIQLLQDYSPEQVERGAMHVLRTYTYKTLPPFAVLRQAIHDACGIPKQEEDSSTQTQEAEAEAAWIQVFSQIGEVGSYGSPVLTPAQAYAVRICGGWQRLCACSRDELAVWTRRTFLGAYTHYSDYGSAMEEGPGAVRRALEARRQEQAQILSDGAKKMLEQK